MSNILNSSNEPQADDEWTDFLGQPMSSLIGQSDSELGANAPTGFKDRYNLAMRFVYLLGVAAVVGLGIFFVSTRESNEKLLVSDGDGTTREVVEVPATTSVPTSEPVQTTEQPATVDELNLDVVEANGVPDTSRYEFVEQTDDAEGPYWYVLDKEEGTRLWAGECLDELGDPDREILWAELSDYAEPDVFTECDALVPLIKDRPFVDDNPSTEVPDTSRYEFVEQTDDAEGPYWYVLDKEEGTRLWAGECLDELGDPDREILWAELSDYAEPDVFTECDALVPLIKDR